MRLRNETSSRSRSLTPEKLRVTPPKAGTLANGIVKSGSLSPSSGTKRKAEDDDACAAAEGREGVPPAKKLAV